MRKLLLLAAGSLLGFTGLLLPGCTIATPFSGPGYAKRDGVLIESADAPLILAVTSTVLDRGERRPFDRAIGEVTEAMPSFQGLVGFSFRKEVFGSRAWTMSVWESEAALEGFLRSQVHAEAMRAGLPATEEFRFYSAPIAAGDVPIAWKHAVALVDEFGAEY